MAQIDPDESYLTVAEVASVLKLNQQTVRNWIDQGQLPALRVGRRVRIKQSDFARILEESYSGGPGRGAATGPSAADFWSGQPVGLAEAPADPSPDTGRRVAGPSEKVAADADARTGPEADGAQTGAR